MIDFSSKMMAVSPVTLQDGGACILGQPPGGVMAPEIYFTHQVWEYCRPDKEPHGPANEDHHGENKDQQFAFEAQPLKQSHGYGIFRCNTRLQA